MRFSLTPVLHARGTVLFDGVHTQDDLKLTTQKENQNEPKYIKGINWLQNLRNQVKCGGTTFSLH